jgi:hypothetical protein
MLFKSNSLQLFFNRLPLQYKDLPSGRIFELYILGLYGKSKKPTDTSNILGKSLLSSLKIKATHSNEKIHDVFGKEIKPLSIKIGFELKKLFPHEKISVVSTLGTELDRYYGVDFIIRIGNNLIFVDITLQPYVRKPLDRKRQSNHHYIRFTEYYVMSQHGISEFCRDVKDRLDIPYDIFKHTEQETAEAIISILDTYKVM